MRHLARRLFAPASALSLLLCMAACALWVRSYRVGDFLHSYRPGEGREFGLISSAGGTSFYRAVWRPRLPDAREPSRFGHHVNPSAGGLETRLKPGQAGPTDVVGPVAGFAFAARWPNNWGNYYFEVMAPHWFWVAAFGAPPLLWFRRARARGLASARAAAGLCRRCGYDLRGSPARCPECGTRQDSRRVDADVPTTHPLREVAHA